MSFACGPLVSSWGRGLTLVLPLVAVAVLLAASAIRIRLYRWHDRNSRPFTVALAAMAGAAVVDGVGDYVGTAPLARTCVDSPDHLVVQALTVVGACMIAIAVAAAWESTRAVRTFRRGVVVLMGLVMLGYIGDMFTPCEWPYLYLIPTPVVGVLACGAILVTALATYRHVSVSHRAPLRLLAGGAVFGLAASVSIAWGLVCSIEHARLTTVFGCLAVILFAASGLASERECSLKDRTAHTA
jgi:hypothetical protein